MWAKEKQMKKKIVAMGFGMIMFLASCSGKDIVEGSWVITKAYAGETEVTAEQIQEAGIGGTTFTFDDGVVEIKMAGSSEVSEGTYKLDGTNITISTEGEEVEFKGTVVEDVLTIEDEELDMSLLFERE